MKIFLFVIAIFLTSCGAQIKRESELNFQTFLRDLEKYGMHNNDSISVVINMECNSYTLDEIINIEMQISNNSKVDFFTFIPPQNLFNVFIEIFDEDGMFINSDALITPAIIGENYKLRSNESITSYLIDDLNNWYKFEPESYSLTLIFFWNDEIDNKGRDYYTRSNSVKFTIEK